MAADSTRPGDLRCPALLLHGAPGDASEWAGVMEALLEAGLKNYHFVAVDRPAYRDTAASGRISLSAEIELLEAEWFASPRAVECCVLIGFSYGAAVALALAERLRSRGEPVALCLIAGVLDPSLDECRWYHRLLSRAVARPFVPRAWHTAAREMSRVNRALASVQGAWKLLDCETLLIHGDEDRLISIQHSEFAAAQLDPDEVRFERVAGADHALLRTHCDQVAAAIIAWLGSLEADGRSDV